jgi:hypothetical protein
VRDYLATGLARHYGAMDSRRIWRLSLTLVLHMIWAASALAQPVVTSLAGCGRITKNGIYNLDSPSVTNSGFGDCITIAAANVVLNLNGSTIAGSGSGTGIHVTGSVGRVRATNNGRYGVWLLSTSHNDIGGFFVEDNAFAGVYVGCSVSGPIAAPCKPAVPASKSNAVFDGSVQASSNGTQTYGVVIDTGNDSNRVTNISSPSPYEKYDLDDANHECAHNVWLGNGVIFSLTPTDCIH